MRYISAPIWNHMKRFLLILITAFSFTANAQLKLKLKSGTYEVKEGSFLQIQSNAPTYGVAIWNHAVSVEDKKALADLGIELYHYLPENAFEVRLPIGIEARDLQNAGVESFTAWTPRMKLDGPLSIGDIPSWAILNSGEIAVQFSTTKEFTNLPSFAKQVKPLIDGWYSITLKLSDLEKLAKQPNVIFIQAIEEPGSIENFNSRSSSRVAYMQQYGDYTGENVVVAVGDDGDIGPHDDYKGRLTSLAGNSIGDHGDHVAGTVFAAGNIDPDGAGSATGASMIYYDYPQNLSNIDNDYNLYGIRVTNSSYSNGCNAGYTLYAQQMDKDIRDNNALMHVFSAGNNNGSNCGYGAGSQWGNVTGGHKQGKNVVATANITYLDAIAPSSSRGPAADGRIKPDLAAVGTNVYSTIDGHTYGNKTGTSMAAPGVAGFFTVLHGAFDQHQGYTATGGLLKAIAMNTAEDLGNDGPDFIFGYGRVNARRAISSIQDTAWFSGNAALGGSYNYTIGVPPGAKELRAMLYWTDPEGSTSASEALVNNLDFTVTDITNSTTYQPWVLNPAPNNTTLNDLAVRGTDSLNNAEQVTILNPSAGDYQLNVAATNVPQGPQTFYVVYYMEMEEAVLTYPHTNEALVPGATVVRWDGAVNGLTWEFSPNGGTTWNTLSLSPITGQGMANWTIPNIATDAAYLRLIKGNDTSVAGPMTIIPQPTGLVVDWVCPDSLKITINPVTTATDYTAYILGNKFMDSVFTDVNNSMIIPYVVTSDTWISASANVNGSQGKRAYAISLPSGTQNCPLPRDLQLKEVMNPQFVSSCQSNLIEVSVQVRNPSTSALDTLPVAYKYQGVITRDTIFGTVASYADTIFVFSDPISWSGTTNGSIQAWTELSGDMNGQNDTVVQTITYLNSALYSLPFLQDFNSFSNCATSLNCGATVCNLSGDWTNLINGSEDGIDWRTHNGGTASNGTGPSSGFGNSGKYLYLEASGSCNFEEAVLYSPCIDLSNAFAPELEFAYHMLGGDMGSLTVEIFNGTTWTMLLNESGDKGNNWQVETINLSAFAGDTVLLRFIGITGDGYQSDLAIDNIAIVDNIGTPIADFSASPSLPCLNSTVTLLDQSAKTPSNWNWTITPTTFSFTNGTSASSQNPEIIFNAIGSYTVTLIASNSYGSDTLTKVNEIVINPLPVLPIIETFSTTTLQDFSITNADNGTTWSRGDVDGPTGVKSGAMYMDYFNYNAAGTTDGLLSPKFDISGYTDPTLMFDVSYAPYSGSYFDQLAVVVSGDCGNTLDTLYLKEGANLGTVAASTSTFVPSGSSDWRTDTVHITNLSSTDVQFEFVGICGYGNNLYLDNIRVIDLGGNPSTANLNLPSTICEDEPFLFSLSSLDSTVDGQFGLNRSGSSVVTDYTGMGAHTATLNVPADYHLEYVYYNAYSFVADSAILIPGPQLRPQFSLSLAGNLSYNFQDATVPAPSAWLWEFGDGNTSSLQNPQHTYAQPGSYTVKLTVTTDCGIKSTTTTFNNIDLDENAMTQVVFYPNPTEGQLNISSLKPGGEATVEIYSAIGTCLQRSTYADLEETIVVDLSTLPQGLYTLKVTSRSGVISQNITKI